MAFKDRLKEARLSKKLTQEQVAKQIGVAKSTFTGYEKGNSEPNMLNISKIMEVLNVDANFLFQDEVKKTAQIFANIDEKEILEKYRALDAHGKEMVDFTLSKEWERSIELSEQATTDEENVIEIQPHLLPNAAHESSTPYTVEERQEDENMLD